MTTTQSKLTPSPHDKIFHLRQYIVAGNHDYGSNDYFCAPNFKKAESIARGILANDWDEASSESWSPKYPRVTDDEGRALFAELCEIGDIFDNLKLEKARPPVKIVLRGGVVQDVPGLPSYDILDYDAIEAGDISAETIMIFGNLKEITPHQEKTCAKKLPKGRQLYTAVSEDDLDFLVVGSKWVNRFAQYLGDDLGWEMGTRFPFEPETD